MQAVLTIVGFVLAGALYWAERYDWLFWLLVYLIASHAYPVIRSAINPVWYIQKRMEADQKRMEADLNPAVGLGGLFLLKGIVIAVLGIAAWYVGIRAGYF